ncbi:ABC transporter permease [Mesorhizobium sp. Cs1321R2N1]|uniref:ABC transporter permease n=1 Tax=Mesorhizobium sp. Cs1321R2N1 TaxID=3015174 RepID=UPI00301D4994
MISGDTGITVFESQFSKTASTQAASRQFGHSRFRGGKARSTFMAALPAMPLLIFLFVFLVLPMSFIVHTAISDKQISSILPRTTNALEHWSGTGLPEAEIYKSLGQELEAASNNGSLRQIGRRVEFELTRGSTIILNAQNSLANDFNRSEAEAWKATLIEADPALGQTMIWKIIQRYDGRYSTFYLRWATGFTVKFNADGRPSAEPGYDFRAIYIRTIAISILVTALTILVGYPVAYVIAGATGRTAAILLFFILLPFWTSLLVRTMSWIVVLQTNGVLNEALEASGLRSTPLSLLYTRTATLLAMIQIQLPFTVLPMISVMRAIPANQVRAARSLGAAPLFAHRTIFLPQALPGIAAGGLLTFVLCLGFYLTPALVGGPSDQMVSFFIARFTNQELNWGLAAALSVVLVIGASLVALPLARLVALNSSGRA